MNIFQDYQCHNTSNLSQTTATKYLGEFRRYVFGYDAETIKTCLTSLPNREQSDHDYFPKEFIVHIDSLIEDLKETDYTVNTKQKKSKKK